MGREKSENKKNNLEKKNKSFCNKENFFCNKIFFLKKFFSEQEKKIVSSQRKQFTFFVLIFVFFYLFLSMAISPFENNLKEFSGKTAEAMLSIQGIEISEQGFYQGEEEIVYSFFAGEKQIIISGLCAGILEIIILVSTLLATLGISWRKKLIGIIIGIIAGIIFNIIRIWITINIILTQETQVIEFAHDILFRIILFVYIIGFYVTWFYLNNKK